MTNIQETELFIHLKRNPGMMYVFPSREAAAVLNSTEDGVIILVGDFSGNEEDVNREFCRVMTALLAQEN